MEGGCKSPPEDQSLRFFEYIETSHDIFLHERFTETLAVTFIGRNHERVSVESLCALVRCRDERTLGSKPSQLLPLRQRVSWAWA